jgi:hypothetical protein
MEDPMSKSAKRQVASSAHAATTPPQPAKINARSEDAQAGSKQSRVIAMLQSPAGATVTAMMQTTDWQQHSVRGFLAGVVRKRLKLKLESRKVDGVRIYRIAGRDVRRPKTRPSKRQSS